MSELDLDGSLLRLPLTLEVAPPGGCNKAGLRLLSESEWGSNPPTAKNMSETFQKCFQWKVLSFIHKILLKLENYLMIYPVQAISCNQCTW